MFFTKLQKRNIGIDAFIKEALGFNVGNRVFIPGMTIGTIIGFGSALHQNKTAFVELDCGLGNHGNYHCCGTGWLQAVA